MTFDFLQSRLHNFEDRNNISAGYIVYSDGSCSLEEFWSNEILASFENVEEMSDYLSNTSYELDEHGFCILPIKEVKK